MAAAQPDLSELSRDFQSLGFTEYEGRVYVALLKSSPATAYEISKENGLIRANVYGALEALERKQAVHLISQDPAKYVPIAPRVLLGRISRNIADQCHNLLPRFESIQSRSDDDAYVWKIDGEVDTRAKIHEMIHSAKNHIWMKGHNEELECYLDALEEASRRNVAVLLVVFGDVTACRTYENGKQFQVYPHENSGTVVGFGRDLVIMTRDFEEAIVINMRGLTGSHTKNLPVVSIFDSFLRHEIYLAEIFAKVGEEIERHFGPALLSLRKQYLPRPQSRALEASMKGRESDLPPPVVGRDKSDLN